LQFSLELIMFSHRILTKFQIIRRAFLSLDSKLTIRLGIIEILAHFPQIFIMFLHLPKLTLFIHSNCQID